MKIMVAYTNEKGESMWVKKFNPKSETITASPKSKEAAKYSFDTAGKIQYILTNDFNLSARKVYL